MIAQPEGQKGALLFNIIFVVIVVATSPLAFPFFFPSLLLPCHLHFVDLQEWASLERCQVSTRANQHFLV